MHLDSPSNFGNHAEMSKMIQKRINLKSDFEVKFAQNEKEKTLVKKNSEIKNLINKPRIKIRN